MNRTQKFLRNSFSSILLQIVTMIVGFITPRIMLGTYGSEINGLVSSVAQFISYFNLVEAGLSNAATYALYKPLAENNHKAINGVVSAAKKFYNQTGYIFVSLVLGLSIIYPLYIKTNVLSPIGVGMLVLILGTSGTLEFFTLSKYRVLLTADQKTYVISYASIIATLLNVIIIATLAHFKANIVVVRFCALFSVFLRSAILMIYCKKKYKFIDYSVEPNVKSLNKRWDALYLQVLGIIQNGAPGVIITLILKDLKMVSIYSVFNMVIVGINGVLSVFTSGLAASFGEVIAKGEHKTLQKSYKEFEFIYYILITIIYTVALITIMPFINIYTKNVSDTNYNIPVFGWLFVLNGLLFNIKTPQGMLVISAGMYKETRWRSTIQGVIIVFAGTILAFYYGIYGVILGSILSNVYRDIDLLIFIPKKLTKTSVMSGFIRIARIGLCIGISIIPFFYISYVPENFAAWFLYAVLVGIYVFVVVIVINLVFDYKSFVGVLKRFKLLRS